MTRADRILFVIDAIADPEATAFKEEHASLPPGVPVTLLMNKIDALVSGEAPTAVVADRNAAGRLADRDASRERIAAALPISAKTGVGIDALRAHLQQCMGFDAAAGGTVSARARHLEALQRAERHAETAFTQLTESRAGELVAEELRSAQQALAEITGEFHADDLLGRIFGSFCIGK
jgi:tRNA modification GTPase